MSLPLPQFEKQLSDTGVLSAEELKSLRESLRPPPTDAEQLAEALVRQQKLTRFQAQRALAGEADSLVFDEYVIIDRIGAGGMGDVFKARHKRMKRFVAVKAISPRAVDSPQAVARFHREVEAAAQLEHPNIVTAYDAREVDGQHYLIMQYVDGEDLSTLVKQRGPLPVHETLGCILQAARGLEYAHEQGIIHRDIKPANLLVRKKDGKVKILDMGLARLQAAEADGQQLDELTVSGQIMGTVDYMPPEQAIDTRKADARSDIYALGCTLYRILTGRTMYAGETAMQKLLAHREEAIPSLSAARRDVPPELDAAYQQMVAKEPSDRPASMAEVIALLEPCLQVVGSASLTDDRPTESLLSSDDSDSFTAATRELPSGELPTIDLGQQETATTEYQVAKPQAASSSVTKLSATVGLSGSLGTPRNKRGSTPTLYFGIGAAALCLLLLV